MKSSRTLRLVASLTLLSACGPVGTMPGVDGAVAPDGDAQRTGDEGFVDREAPGDVARGDGPETPADVLLGPDEAVVTPDVSEVPPDEAPPGDAPVTPEDTRVDPIDAPAPPSDAALDVVIAPPDAVVIGPDARLDAPAPPDVQPDVRLDVGTMPDARLDVVVTPDARIDVPAPPDVQPDVRPDVVAPPDTGSGGCSSDLQCAPAASAGVCAGTGRCVAGRCVVTPALAGTSCDDANACTDIDRCDGEGRCLGVSTACDVPAVDLTAACAGRTSTTASLAATCAVVSGAARCTPSTAVTVACPAGATPIAQSKPWHIVLRSHIASLAASAFDLPARTVDTTRADALGDDELYRLWLVLAGNGLPELPSTAWMHLPSSAFTLASLEASGRINLAIGRGRVASPEHIGWWARWDYAGNPMRNAPGALNRAFVAGAVDLIASDAYLDASANSGARRLDYLGFLLLRHAYTYRFVRDALPATVRDAYAAGLRALMLRVEYVDRAVNGHTWGVFGDMTTPTLAGAFSTGELLDDAVLRDAARYFARRIIQRYLRADGYVHHEDSYDSTYNGISLRFGTWGALVTDDAAVRAMLDGLMRLKAHTTLTVPSLNAAQDRLMGHEFFGPNHTSPATFGGAPDDQWYAINRENALAALTDHARYLVQRPRTVNPGDAYLWDRTRTDNVVPPYSHAELLRVVRGRLTVLQSTLAATPSPLPTAGTWGFYHWVEPLPYFALHPRAGAFARIASEGDPNATTYPAVARPPFARATDFVERFGTEMASARVGNVGAVVSAVPLASRDYNSMGLSGLGGGALSAFWTPRTGPVLLGMNRGTQSADAQGAGSDRWTSCAVNGAAPCTDVDAYAGPLSWPSHALTGRSARSTPYQGFFSSARVVSPTVEALDVTASTLHFVVSGTLEAGASVAATRSAPSGALGATITYRRTIDVTRDQVQVSTQVLPAAPAEPLHELYETLPVLLRDETSEPSMATGGFAGFSDTLIEFCTGTAGTGTGCSAASESAMAGVRRIRLTRFGASAAVDFDGSSAYSVRLAPEWRRYIATGSSGRKYVRARAVLIDLLPSGSRPVAAPAVTVRYTLRAL